MAFRRDFIYINVHTHTICPVDMRNIESLKTEQIFILSLTPILRTRPILFRNFFFQWISKVCRTEYVSLCAT